MSYDHWLDLGQNQDYCNDLQPEEQTEQDYRRTVARGLRSIREQIRQMGRSTVTCGVLREWKDRGELLQIYRRADVAWQRGGRHEFRRTA